MICSAARNASGWMEVVAVQNCFDGRDIARLGEVPVPLNRRMGAMPPDLSGVGVAAAETFASPRTPQAVKAVEIRTSEAMMRTRHGVSIPGSETLEYTTSL